MPLVLPFALVRKLCALADPALRRAALADALGGLDEASVAMFLAHLAGGMHEPDHRLLWREAALVLLEGTRLEGERLAGVRERLAEDPRAAVFAFLDVGPDERRAGSAGPPQPYSYDDVPLGVRKARARQRNRDALRILTADPDPSVIRILLENPTLVDSEVLAVASRRPQTPGTFVELLASTRFGVREAVQAAIVLNPWCPVRAALATVPLLGRARLREVESSAQLDARVRAAAAAMLSQV